MSKLKQLTNLGQSIWYDYIRRSLITTGELQKLIDEGLRGITSNPTIFEKAIAGSADYDSALNDLVNANKSIDEIYEALVLEDIGNTADLFRDVYETTNGLDGYVSLEVNPGLAYDAEGTIKEAVRLFTTLKRPNVMIKVPATQQGMSAITELISHGINVNATLMFSMDHYLNVTNAYLNGLEQLLENGGDLTKVASVASFFVSRVDSAVDKALAEIGNKELQGKIAIANSKLVYQKFLEVFSGPRWEKLAQNGAQVQRVLWASTSTKNPDYSDNMYVDNLIGKNTVNTLPPVTLTALRDHGNVAVTIDKDIPEAKDQLSRLNKLGIDLDSITDKLQTDGVAAFSDSFDKLMNAITEKRDLLLTSKKKLFLNLNNYQSIIDDSLIKLKRERVVHRIWEHDYTVWKPEPSEITNRLGWLHSPEIMVEAIENLQKFVDEVRTEGFTHALLLGMGGSSLAPEMFRRIFGVKTGYLDLAVLDSTNPDSVLSLTRALDPEKTLYISSTKSGSTVETLSLTKYFYNQTLDSVGKDKAGNHFIAITDSGSGLESLAKTLNFRRIFLNDSNIGGRYSALSHFGLVPAALIGIDLRTLLDRAQRMACNCEGCNYPVNGDNSGAILGTILGTLAPIGRDKLTFIMSPAIKPFEVWIEQLIAESTGKEGLGILPVVGESILRPKDYADDRMFVYLKLNGDNTQDGPVKKLVDNGYPVVQINLQDQYDLGGELFRWEMATAITGHYLKINPFDQPNVEAAKVLARQMLSAYREKGKLPEPEWSLKTDNLAVFTEDKINSLEHAINQFFNKTNLEKSGVRNYVAIQAFIQPTDEINRVIHELRTKIQKKFRLATAVGYGPRFLHSTGQLHKGDAGNGLFVQITEDHTGDIAIPDNAGEESSSITFGILALAQALGDRQALLDAKRHVIRFHFSKDTVGGIRQLTAALN